MGYFTKYKIGNGSSKYDYDPYALDKDLESSRKKREQFKKDFIRLLKTDYYIKKETSYGRYLTQEEKIEIIIDEIYNIRKEQGGIKSERV